MTTTPESVVTEAEVKAAKDEWSTENPLTADYAAELLKPKGYSEKCLLVFTHGSTLPGGPTSGWRGPTKFFKSVAADGSYPDIEDEFFDFVDNQPGRDAAPVFGDARRHCGVDTPCRGMYDVAFRNSVINSACGKELFKLQKEADELYKVALVEAVFKEAVVEELKAGLSDDAQNFLECAKNWNTTAKNLAVRIDEFWTKAPEIMFEGADLSGVRYPGGHTSRATSAYDINADETGRAATHIAGSDSSHSYITTPHFTGGNLGANMDHIMLSTYGINPSQLKLSEAVDGSTNMTIGTTEIEINSANKNKFPFYYASLVVAVFNLAAKVVFNAPTDDEIKGLQQEAGTPWNDVSQKNHANAEGLVRGSPSAYATSIHGMYYEYDAHYLPTNALQARNISMDSDDYTEPTKRYDFEAVYKFAVEANHKVSSFYDNAAGQEVSKFITEQLEQIKVMMDQIKNWSDCIKKADKEVKEEIAAAADAFKAGMESTGLPFTGWFKDKSLNALVGTFEGVIDGMSPDSFFGSGAEQNLFREQCFLLSFVSKISDYKKNTLDYVAGGEPKHESGIHKRIPYVSTGFKEQDSEYNPSGTYNASLMVQGDAYGFINRLTQNPNYGAFFDIDNWHLSGMQPRIRLFKVIYDDKGEEKEVEMSFNSHFRKDELALFKDRKSRGVGVGLKSFNFTYDGSNPFAVKKSIKATLKIFANSFQELFEDRSGTTLTISEDGKPVPSTTTSVYKYADLALKTWFKDRDEKEFDRWDLILDENANKAKLNFRLKAVVGWSQPPGNLAGVPSDPRYSASDVRKAAADSFVTLNLTPTVHNFDFDDQGRVVFTINYLAYVEDFFDDRIYNVFADPKGTMGIQRETRSLQMKRFARECEGTEGMNELKQTHAAEAAIEKQRSVKNIVNQLADNKKMFYINVPADRAREFVSAGPYGDYESYIDSNTTDFIKNDSEIADVMKGEIQKALDSANAAASGGSLSADTDEMNALRASLVSINPNSDYVVFFYLSDLIDIVLMNIEKELNYLHDKIPSQISSNEPITENLAYTIDAKDIAERISAVKRYKKNFTKMRILTGPVELTQPANEGNGYYTTWVNFGDLPISVRYFAEFLGDKVFKKDESTYSLTRFLNDLFNNLVDNFLNSQRCFDFDIKQKVRVNQCTLTSYASHQIGSDTKDSITALIEKKANKIKRRNGKGSPSRLHLKDAEVLERLNLKKPILNISGEADEFGAYAPLSHEINYFVYFAARTRPADRMTGNKQQDLQGGIFHYLLGRDKGIIKNIKLIKTQTPGLQEVRFEQEGYDGLEQLRVVYDVEIDCYANVNTFPGTYIYIPPEGFDPTIGQDMTKFGIGGYYMIYRSSHNFASGDASSKIYAKWVAQIESESNENSAGKVPTPTAKCPAVRLEQSDKK